MEFCTLEMSSMSSEIGSADKAVATNHEAPATPATTKTIRVETTILLNKLAFFFLRRPLALFLEPVEGRVLVAEAERVLAGLLELVVLEAVDLELVDRVDLLLLLGASETVRE